MDSRTEAGVKEWLAIFDAVDGRKADGEGPEVAELARTSETVPMTEADWLAILEHV
jgi:hypothetical protein